MLMNFIMFLVQVFKVGKELFVGAIGLRIWGGFPLQIIDWQDTRRLLLVEGKESDSLKEEKASLVYRGPPRIVVHTVDKAVNNLCAGSG